MPTNPQKKSLAYIFDEERTGLTMMESIETRLVQEIARLAGAVKAVDLSFIALRRYATRRTTQSALFCVPILVHRKDFSSWMNSLQEKCSRRMLQLHVRVPRAILMKELGEEVRWSTRALTDAILLMAGAYSNDSESLIVKVLDIAMTHPTAWTSTVLQTMTSWGIPPFLESVSVDDKSSRSAAEGF